MYAPKIDIIDYEEDVFYKNVNPIKVIDNENLTQYYFGGFNKKGQCHGKGIWVKDFNVYVGNFKNDEFHGTGLFITEQGDYYGITSFTGQGRNRHRQRARDRTRYCHCIRR